MPKLRVVKEGGEESEVSFGEAARSALEKVLAKAPAGLVIMFETGDEVAFVAVPGLNSMVRGMAIEILHALDEPFME